MGTQARFSSPEQGGRATDSVGTEHGSTTYSEHRVTQSAIMASEIEALPDRAGYLNSPRSRCG
jgi:hypothetical protein